MTTLKPDRVFFALGLIGLGVLSLVYGDFALQWQPVPAWVPGRTFLAYASGAVMILCGAGLLSRRTASFASSVLLVYTLMWLLLLKLPHVVMDPLQEFNWLGFGEIAMIVAGSFVLFARDHGQPESSKLKFATGESGVRIARYLFGLAVIPVGLSHFVYAKETIGFVPAWIPFRPAWAYLTGAGHIAAGLGVLFGVVPRLAALLEAAMIGVFTVLVWVPLVAKESTQLNWTGLLISWIIGAAAWVVAGSLSNKQTASRLPDDLRGGARGSA
ncbi:MAG TPA: DoxX family membrane protein [Gemmatimonadaceae bacterium]|nr:DoxX family membrane protein [Gemmatimonadaceae bacterium]